MTFEWLVFLAFGAFVSAVWLFLNDKASVGIEQIKRTAKLIAQLRGGRVVPLLSDDSVTVEWLDERDARGQLVLKLDGECCICELSYELQDVSAAWSIKGRLLNGDAVLSYQDTPLELDAALWRALLGLHDAQPSSAFEVSRRERLWGRCALEDGRLSWRCGLAKSLIELKGLDALSQETCKLFLSFAQEVQRVTRAGGEEALFERLILSDAPTSVRRWALSSSAQLGWSHERSFALFERLMLRPGDLGFALEFLSDELLQQLPLERRLLLLELAIDQAVVAAAQARLMASCQERFEVEQLDVEQLIASPRACFKLMRASLVAEDDASWEVVKARARSGVGRFDAAGYVELLELMAQHPLRGWAGVLEAIPEQALSAPQVIEGVLSYCESTFMKGEGLQGSSGLAQTLVWSMARARQGQLERLVPLLLNVCGELALAPLVEAQRHSDTMEAAGREASRRALEKLVGTLKLDVAKVGALSVAGDSAQGGLSVAGEAGTLTQV